MVMSENGEEYSSHRSMFNQYNKSLSMSPKEHNSLVVRTHNNQSPSRNIVGKNKLANN